MAKQQEPDVLNELEVARLRGDVELEAVLIDYYYSEIDARSTIPPDPADALFDAIWTGRLEW